MSKEFYVNHRETIPWTEATSRWGSMTYDDVLIMQEALTKVESRAHVSTTVKFGPYELAVPIVTAPMDTVSGEQMIRAMHSLGAIGSLPRGDRATNLQICEKLSNENIPCLYAIGLSTGFSDAKELKERGAQMVLIDVAHGGMEQVNRLAGDIKSQLGLTIVAGNITTYDQARVYKEAGIDIARVGVGAGSVCTTRLIAGVGMPQLNAIFETTESGIYVIADGGITKPADLAKALAGGANIGMIGGMFAGADETPGEVHGGYKTFRGQASQDYMADNGIESGEFRAAEGISVTVPIIGPVQHVVHRLLGGLRSTMSYVGARNIAELQEIAQFIRISPATQLENMPHMLQRI